MENQQTAMPSHKTFAARVKRKIKFLSSKVFVGSYRAIRSQSFFMDFLNKRVRTEYNTLKGEIPAFVKEIVAGLNKEGIYFTTLEKLFNDPVLLETLRAYVLKEFDKASIGSNKKFLMFLWDNAPTLDLNNPIVKIALSETLVMIANEYLETYSRFAFYSVNRTIVVGKNAGAQGSQRWHRDPTVGDKKLFKAFVYFNDVDEKAGPFMFVKGSHETGRYAQIFPAKGPNGVYPPDGAVENEPSLKKEIIAATGKAGTVVFCDTSGIHKGGFSVERERLMATFLYVTPASLQPENFSFPDGIAEKITSLPAIVQRALRLPR